MMRLYDVQVKADRIVSTGVDLEKLGILTAVKTGLAPWASRVHATLDKLNMYSRGGVIDYDIVASIFSDNIILYNYYITIILLLYFCSHYCHINIILLSCYSHIKSYYYPIVIPSC